MLYAKLNHYDLPVVNLMHVQILILCIGAITHFLFIICVSLAEYPPYSGAITFVAGEDGYLYEMPVSVDQGDANE